MLRLEEIDRPAVGDEEVLLRVHAAGVDRGVWHLMTGLPYPVRLAGYGIRAPKTRVRGREVAGRVEAVGQDVTGCKSATRCSASPTAPSPSTPAPGRTSCAQAREPHLRAGRGRPLLGADRPAAVRDGGHVQPGRGPRHRRVGRRRDLRRADRQGGGAEVTGVGSTAKLDLVRSLGADHVIDYPATTSRRVATATT